MRSPGASGSIKEIKELRSRVAKLERVNRKLAKSKSPDSKLDKTWIELRRIFDAIEDSIMVLDNEFRIARANLATSHFVGKPLKEIIGKTCCQIVHGKDKPPEGCPLRKAQSSKCHEEMDLYISEKDIWIEASVDPVIDEKGKISGAVHIIKNINDRKKGQEAYHSLVDHSLQGLAIFQEGRIVFANQAMAQITGYSVDEMLASPPEKVQAFVHPEDRELVWMHHKQRLQGKLPPERYVLRGIRKDGFVLWLEIYANLIEYHGKPAVQAAYLDITDRRNAEQRERVYIRDLQYLSESATEFVKLTPDQDIYTLIAKKIQGLCERSIVVVNTYDEASESLCVRALVGLGKYAQAVSQIMGAHPIGQCFPLDGDGKEGLGQGKLLKVPGGIYDLSPGIPKVVCQAIEKLLGLGDVYAMGLNSEGRLYGSVAVLTRSNTNLKNQELIETFMNQAAVAIQRWEADLALRKSEAGLARAQQIAHIGSWDWDVENQVLIWSDEVYRIFGVQKDFQLSFEGIEAMIHPDDRVKNRKFVNESLSTVDFADIELRIIRPDTAVRHIYQNAEVWRDEAGNVRRIFGVIQDITERKKAEEDLRQSEERHRLLLKHAGCGIGYFDLSGKILFFNDKALQNLGGIRADCIGRTVHEVFGKTLGDLTIGRIKYVSDTKQSKQYEDEVELPAGTKCYISVYSPIRDSKDKCIGIQIISHDITERKKAERERQRFTLMVESSNEFMGIATLDGKVQYLNKAGCRLAGLDSQEEAGKKTIFEFVDDETKARLNGEILPELTKHGKVQGEGMIRHFKSGRLIDVAFNLFFVRSPDTSEPVNMAVVMENIAKRKKTEEALKESEHRFKTLFECAPDAIYLVDIDGNFVAGNKAAEKMIGYKREELIGSNFVEAGLLQPEEIPKALVDLEKNIKGEPGGPGEFTLIHKDGSLVPVEIRTFPVRIGNQTLVLGIARDITERKQAEKELRDSEEQFRVIFAKAGIGMAIVDSVGRIVDSNATLQEMLGYNGQELASMIFSDFTLPDDVQEDWELFQELFRGKRERYQIEKCYVRKDGQLLWGRLTATLVRDASGEPRFGIGMIEDITERKKAENAIRESEARLRQAQEVAHVGSWQLVLRTGRLVWSDETYRIFGVPIGRPMKEADFQTIIHPDDLSYVKSSWAAAIQGRPYDIKHRIVVGDTVKWVHEKAKLEFDTEGKPLSGIGTIQDITEQKKSEEALRYSERLLKEAQKVAHIGHWEFDPKGGVPEWSEEIFHIFGLDPKKDEPSFVEHENHVQPDDWPILNKAVTKTSRDGTPFDIQFRIVRPSGQTRWMHALGTATKNAQGAVTKLFGTAQDITERKQAEQEIENMAKFPSENPYPVFRVSRNGTVMYANSVSIEFLGDKNTGIDQPVPQQWRHMVENVLASGTVGRIEVNHKGCVLAFRIVPVIEAGYANFYGTDITERKRAEEALRTSETRLSEAMKIAKLAHWEYDVADNVFIFNDQFYSVYRSSVEQVGGYRVSPSRYAELFLHPDDRPELNEEILRAIETTDPNFKCEAEHRFIYGDGKIGYVSVRYFVVKDSQGRPVKTYGVNQDITEHKSIMKALEQSEEKYRDLFEHASDAIVTFDTNGNITDANKAVKEYGIKREELMGRSLLDYVIEGHRARAIEDLETLIGGRPVHGEMDVITPKGTFTVEYSDNPIMRGKDIVGVQAILTDITERKRAEDRLREYQAKLKAMASERLMAEERERRRIAIGLHDDICQKLVISKFALESSLKSISDTNVSKSLRIISEAIGETIHQVESLTFELSNPVLREFGLIAALEKYLDEEIRQEHGISYDLQSDSQLGSLQDEIEICLFRIIKELLTNVVKHAQAHKINVSVRKHNQKLYFRIQDDGVGFNVADAGSKTPKVMHFGLFSVREQLDDLGGTLSIESEPGRGTTATVVVPLENK